MSGDPTSPGRVSILCTEASHEGRVTRIATFVQQDMTVTDDDAWHEEEVWSRSRGPSGVDASAGFLAGDDVLPASAGYFDDVSGRSRARYALECKLCGLRVEARAERLWPVLARARLVGASWLPLGGLAARLP